MTKTQLNKLLNYANLCAICHKFTTTIYDSFGQIVRVIPLGVDDLKEADIEAYVYDYIAGQKQKKKKKVGDMKYYTDNIYTVIAKTKAEAFAFDSLAEIYGHYDIGTITEVKP